jgi:DNA-binding MarR family transcriptional regulator
MKKSASTTDYPLEPAMDFLQRLGQLNQALEQVSSRMETTLGVSAQQRLLLRCIGKYPGLTPGHVASLLHVDPGTVSASLKRLERRGLLERRRDPRDSRRVVLGLTARGRKLDVPADGTVERGVERLLAAASPAELAATLGVLERLTGLLRGQTDAA